MAIETVLKRRKRVFLTLVILLAIALRLYGIGWGLPNQWHPYSYHPDEARLFSYMVNMHPAQLDFNPDDFAYPTFHVLLVGAFLLVLSKVGLISIVPSLQFYASHPQEFAAVFLAARLVTVAMAVASIYLVYLIGQQLYNQRVGLWAAFLFAIAPVHVVDSHYFTLDVPMAFWMLLVMLFSVYIYRFRSSGWYALAGICLGLAASTKYPGASAAVFIITAHAMGVRKADEPLSKIVLDIRIWTAAVLALIAFAAGTPYSVIEPTRFGEDLVRTFSASAGFIDTGALGYNEVLAAWGQGWIKYPYVHTFLATFPFILGWAWYLFFIWALIVIVSQAKRRWPVWLLSVFGILYTLNVGRWLIQGQRYYIPLLPVIAIATAAGYGLIRMRTDRGWCRMLWAVMLVYTLAFTVSIDLKFNDTIDDGFAWAYENIPEGAAVATTLWAPLRYSPLADPAAYSGVEINTERVIGLRHNNATSNDDMVFTRTCKDIKMRQCKGYNVVTMINPSDDWLKKYDPDWMILSSMEYIGDNPPPKYFDLNISNGRDFYKGIRKTCQYPQYRLVHVIDRPYLTEALYTAIEPRYKSYFPSPRIEFYRKEQDAAEF